MQNILAYIALGLALGFFVKKFFFKSKKKNNQDPGCDGCH
jgi:hypothetical protein